MMAFQKGYKTGVKKCCQNQSSFATISLFKKEVVLKRLQTIRAGGVF